MWLSRHRRTEPWSVVLKRTLREIDADNCLGLAAQLAFYLLLALFPTLLFLVALLGYLPVGNSLPQLMTALGRVAPPEVIHLVNEQLVEITKGGRAGLLSVGVLGALWSSSAAMVALVDVLNRVYAARESRAWWKRRGLAIGLTVILGVFFLIALTLIIIGPAFATRIADWLGLGAVFIAVWSVVRWPLMFLCGIVGVDLVYNLAPNRKAAWNWLTPGAVFATSLWVVASFAFKLYVANLANYNATYGTIGGVIVTLLWLYVFGLAILVGGELNGSIEKSSEEFGAIARSPAA